MSSLRDSPNELSLPGTPVPGNRLFRSLRDCVRFLPALKVFCRLQTAGIFHALMALLSNERLIVRRGICRRGRHRLCWFRIWLARYCG